MLLWNLDKIITRFFSEKNLKTYSRIGSIFYKFNGVENLIVFLVLFYMYGIYKILFTFFSTKISIIQNIG